jgi:hypothetical protein
MAALVLLSSCAPRSSSEDVNEIIQLVLDQPGVQRYLSCQQRTTPVTISSANVPTTVSVFACGRRARRATRLDRWRDSVREYAEFERIEVSATSAFVVMRYSAEGLRYEATLTRATSEREWRVASDKLSLEDRRVDQGFRSGRPWKLRSPAPKSSGPPGEVLRRAG